MEHYILGTGLVPVLGLKIKGKMYSVRTTVDPHCKERVFRQPGTCHINCPNIKMMYGNGDWLVGGDIEALKCIRCWRHTG